MVRVGDVIYFDEPLPDEIEAAQSHVGRVKRRQGRSVVKVTLAKRREGLWEERWCVER